MAVFRQKRDGAAVDGALAAIRAASQGSANLMSAIVGAARARATVGEISDALRSIFGEYDRQR